MTPRSLALGAVLLAAACAIGPHYHRPETGAPAQFRPPSTGEDSLAATYDTLAASRDSMAARRRARTDSGSAPGDSPSGAATNGPTPPGFQLSDTAANVGWLDLFQDTVLTQLVVAAIQDNPDVQTAAATVQEYRALLGQATANLFPNITITGQTGRQKQAFGASFTVPAQNYLEALGNVSWELDFWGRLRNLRAEARANLLAQGESRRAVLLSLVGDVATAYLQLRQFDLDLAIAKRTLESRQATYRLSQQKFQGGAIAELDLRQFQGDVGDAAASVAAYEKQVAQTENQLSLLLGRSSEPIPRGRPLNEVLRAVDLPVGIPSQLLERRPDVRQAEAQLRSATASVGAALDARLPTITIGGYWGYENFASSGIPFSDFTSDNNRIYEIFAGVSIPIFDFGRLANVQHAAQARVLEARSAYQKAVLVALRDVNNQLAEVRNDRRQAVALETQVEALRIAYRLSRDRYEAGYAPYLDVLTAQRTLFTAEQSLVAAQFQGLAGVVSLYQSVGGGPIPMAATRGAGPR